MKTGVPPAVEKLGRRKVQKQSELRGKCHMNSVILNLDDKGPVQRAPKNSLITICEINWKNIPQERINEEVLCGWLR